MSWTPEKIELLTSLWNQGWTTARIGEELGVGKNAVVGKAHRLGLPKRPSPIQRRAEEAEQKPRPPSSRAKAFRSLILALACAAGRLVIRVMMISTSVARRSSRASPIAKNIAHRLI